MDWLNFVAGAALVVLVMVDACWTTLTTRGAGVFTGMVTNTVRWCAITLSRNAGRRAFLVAAGPLAITLMGLVWVTGLWAGWVLMFAAIPGAVQQSSTMMPATAAGDLVYFVGFTLSTLGVGDLVPAGTLSRVLTAVASFNGLILITLGITYAVPLVSGAVQRRELAFELSLVNSAARAEGSSPLPSLTEGLKSVRRDLMHCTEQRMAYPMLDLYFTRAREFSLPWQLANAVSLALKYLEQDGVRPQDQRELGNFLAVAERYLVLHGLTSGSVDNRLQRLVEKDGWPEAVSWRG
ncbi:ion channel [Marinobacter sp.]|uniref:ion channel n=1 Tax=Marinobacter sp. TaxID=50741 RepID=UPI00356666CE